MRTDKLNDTFTRPELAELLAHELHRAADTIRTDCQRWEDRHRLFRYIYKIGAMLTFEDEELDDMLGEEILSLAELESNLTQQDAMTT